MANDNIARKEQFSMKLIIDMSKHRWLIQNLKKLSAVMLSCDK